MLRKIITTTFDPHPDTDIIETADDLDEFACTCDECIQNRLLDYLEDRAS